MLELLPVSERKTIEFNHFPTKIHAVVFRLWEMIPCERIAQALETTAENIERIAQEMSLGKQKNLESWQSKGYITIIKALWHLVPYEQIMQILGWDEQRLAYVLKEDDFLGIKLGYEKPACEKVVYREFTAEEKMRASEIGKIMREKIAPLENQNEKSEAFDFFNLPYKPLVKKQTREIVVDNEWSMELLCDNDEVKIYADDFKDSIKKDFGVALKNISHKKITVEINSAMAWEEDHNIDISENLIAITGASPLGVMRALYYLLNLAESSGTLSFDRKSYHRTTNFKSRIIYSFCGLYSDVLDTDSSVSFPEELLKAYAKRGINGVWIQAVLYKLVPFKYDESISEGWEMRIENLNKLIKRASRYGIKIYLYINEPRSMPLSFFDKYPHMKGHDNKDNTACMCTSVKEVRDYVYDAFAELTKNAKGLGGFWNICMSENLTHCYSRKDVPMNCVRCKERKSYEVAAEITSVMANAVHSVDKDMKFFVHTWAFDYFNEEEKAEFMKLVPKNVIIVAVSETRIPFEVGGVKCKVDDYSMSRIGPGEWAKKVWSMAQNEGLETCAKIQINTTWECSTAPFLPVYDSVISHLDNLLRLNTEHLYLSWTLGGYVSDNLKIASSYFFNDSENTENSYLEVLNSAYGEYGETVRRAASCFSRGFSEYPFSIGHIYFGPSNFGCANLFFPKSTQMTATMTAFPYDDVKTWCADYTPDILIAQYEKLCKLWEEGLEIIKDMPVCEFTDMAHYGYTLFKSSLNQLKYYKLRDAKNTGEEMQKIIEDEYALSLDVYKLMARNCCIGYEAANHYYASKTMIAEKIIQCRYLND